MSTYLITLPLRKQVVFTLGLGTRTTSRVLKSKWFEDDMGGAVPAPVCRRNDAAASRSRAGDAE
jgi:hypothetical protein